MNGQGPPAPRLLWYDVTRCGEEAGEILAAFELFLVRETKSYLFSLLCVVCYFVLIIFYPYERLRKHMIKISSHTTSAFYLSQKECKSTL